jgi:hypothetical protein
MNRIAILILLIFTACAKKGNLQFSEQSSSAAAPTMFSCEEGSDPGASELRRLTRYELLNTLQDLVGPAAVTSVANQINLLPVESEVGNFETIERPLSPALIQGLFDVAQAIATYIVSNSTELNRIAGSCISLSILSDQCLDTFIRNFGQRAFRRPLTSEEVIVMKALYNSEAAAAKIEGVEAVLMSFLLSPHFQYKIEVSGVAVDGREDLLKLNDFEIATRLSYLIWGSMPDDALLSAAARGQLVISENFTLHRERLLASPRAKKHILTFYQQWLDYQKIPEFSFGAGFPTAANQPGVRTEVINEMDDLVNYVTWDSNGTFKDLIESNISFAKTPIVASIYNVPVWQAGTPAVRLPANERSGILTRAAMLANGEDVTHPFQRGAAVLSKILCTSFPRPEPQSLPPGALDEPLPDSSLSTRERFEHKTSSAQCMTCHSRINPLGFALESYDSLGRYRTAETIYSNDGVELNKVAIDAAVDFIGDSSSPKVINGAVELSGEIADSDSAGACFVRQWFRFSEGRKESANDNCFLNRMHKSLTSVSILEMIKQTASAPEFLSRKVGP